METKSTNAKNIEDKIRELIAYIGEDPDRAGLQETPDRILRMWKEIFRGYDPKQAPKVTTFFNEDASEGMIFDSGDYYSMCEHHILPFFGRYYIAYLPNPKGKIVGLSKIARVVGYCSARLQLQERLAKEIVEMLDNALSEGTDFPPLGFAILLRGKHLCKVMRGVRNNGEMAVTYFTGVFKENSGLRKEFLAMAE